MRPHVEGLWLPGGDPWGEGWPSAGRGRQGTWCGCHRLNGGFLGGGRHRVVGGHLAATLTPQPFLQERPSHPMAAGSALAFRSPWCCPSLRPAGPGCCLPVRPQVGRDTPGSHSRPSWPGLGSRPPGRPAPHPRLSSFCRGLASASRRPSSPHLCPVPTDSPEQRPTEEAQEALRRTPTACWARAPAPALPAVACASSPSARRAGPGLAGLLFGGVGWEALVWSLVHWGLPAVTVITTIFSKNDFLGRGGPGAPL